MGFSEKQKEYFLKATRRWNIKSGATRSGKTYMDYFVIPKRIRNTTNDGLIVILGNTQATVERNILDPMRKIWGDALVGTVKNDNKINLFGKECYVLGADKKNAVTKIQGAGIEYAYGDEITTWAEPVFQMLKSRLDKPNSVFDGTCNPDNPKHWFKEFLDSGADIYEQHYTIDDNPYLSPAFVQALKKEYQGVYYNRFILGQWTRAEGLIYGMFNPDIHVVEEVPDYLEECFVAVDYGTQNATSFLLFGRQNDKWYVVEEYRYSGRDANKQKTDAEYSIEMKNFLDGRYIPIIVDPSAASFITQLRRDGFRVYKAKNDVIDGIRFTQTLFSDNKLFISNTCAGLIDELYGYSWDEKAAEIGVDKPIKENDHSCDALRYGTYTIIRKMTANTVSNFYKHGL
ncbi:PBSX family phage terminase large subunit [Peptoniphilus catoniae]|uniref:PBSX family phage terminase large subunit n=1 Tax=Peptoniphilus catoniae TaxID=1660341 RepID=UPI0010FE1344|nr:PBSX family phage terminase large subunit [Peptoniphilus catoniae]